jgi:hypothetical protein
LFPGRFPDPARAMRRLTWCRPNPPPHLRGANHGDVGGRGNLV